MSDKEKETVEQLKDGTHQKFIPVFGTIMTPTGDLHITDQNIFYCIKGLEDENSKLMKENSQLRLEIFELKCKPKKSWLSKLLGL